MYEIFEQLLQKNHVTAYKLSKDTGISQTTLSNWKSGRSMPKQDKLKKIADYFGVSVDYLLGMEARALLSINSDGAKNRFAAMVNEYPVDSIRILAKLCKSERINNDLSEKSVAISLRMSLEDYLAFENDNRNIGADLIINILSFFNLNLSYITGFITGTLIQSKSDNNEMDSLLNRLLLTEEMKKDITEIIEAKSANEEKVNKYMLSADDDLQTFRNKLSKIIEIIDSGNAMDGKE